MINNLSTFRTKIVFTFIFSLFAVGFSSIGQLNWVSSIDSVSVLSSPRATDLNNDGIKDIVIGSGTDSTFSNYGVVAFDGSNGQILWTMPTNDEIFTSAQFIDLNNDLTDDIIIGGRNAQLYAINGTDGSLIWEFYPSNSSIPPADSGYYNFYTSQLIPDMTGDFVMDILVSNGGDHQATQFDPRPPGHLMIIDAMTGAKIAQAVTPDSAEIYCSPVLYDRLGGSTLMVAFGTGGEDHAGGFYLATLTDIMNNSLVNNAILLQSDSSKGFIAPASLADLTNDGIPEIIVQSFGGSIAAFDGFSFQRIWDIDFPNCESSSAPTIGNFTGGDLVPDIFNVLYRGTTPTYFDFYQIMIDGATGQVAWIDSIGAMHFSSSSAFDANGDGRDEVLISINENTGTFSHQLKLIDFQQQNVQNITPLESGVNLACTPLINDLDGNGTLEFVYVYKSDSINPSAWKGFKMNSFQTNYSLPIRGVAWGSYMGTNYDGHYNNSLFSCSTPIVSNYVVNNPSCNHFSDGKILITSYANNTNTFLWSDGSMSDSLVNISAGTHTLYVTDSNNCVEVHTFQLNDPYIVGFGNVTHNICPGDSIGTASISSSGCVCQFSTCTYNWTNGSLIKHASQLPAGIHVVDIHHPDGCIVTDSIYIQDGVPVIDSSLVTDPSCYYINDASISLFPSHPSTTGFSWSTGSSQSHLDFLPPGDYAVEAYNMNCTDSLFFTINHIDTVSFSANSMDVVCHGDSNGIIALHSIVGQSPFNTVLDGVIYNDTVFNQLSPGNYNLYVSDNNGCNSDTITLNIAEPTPLSILFDVTPATDSGYFDGIAHAIVQGGVSPYHYEWDHLPSINDSIVVYLPNGYYPVTVTDSNGCYITDSAFVGLLSNVDLDVLNDIVIYPVPSDGDVHLISSFNTIFSYAVYDLNGKAIINNKTAFSNEKILFNLPKGQYLLKIKYDRKTIVKKISII